MQQMLLTDGKKNAYTCQKKKKKKVLFFQIAYVTFVQTFDSS